MENPSILKATGRAGFFMKKLMVMMSLCLFCSLCTIVGETEEVRFQIQADSRVHEEAGLKNQIYAVYSELTDGVDTESRPVIIAQNIRAEYQNNTVVITQGDGKGSLIHGSFDAFSCGRPVKPKSWIAELFGHE